MFSDTHFHFGYLHEQFGAKDVSRIFSEMAETDVFFGLDIGTRADDLQSRLKAIKESISFIEDETAKKKVKDFIYFSAGIWPDKDAIIDRENQMKLLEKSIAEFRSGAHEFSEKLIAIGEGGLDHHWNPSGVDGRCESDFDEKVFEGERELFLMELAFAKKMNLPFIVHSRDAWQDTVDVIREADAHNGIIHCYSYGKEELKPFLDMGWYISLSGSVTYAKKSKLDAVNEMMRYIPEDRLLLETDSPYLAPVPERGNTNTPVFVRHTYGAVAAARGISTETLCALVDENIRRLFSV